MVRRLLSALALILAVLPVSAQTPPRAAHHPHVHTEHGVSRSDPYYWLRERENPEVIAYLEAENAYTAAVTAPNAPLETAIYDEIVGRIKQDDASAPTFDRGFWYYTRFETGQDYPVYARRRGTRADGMTGPEEVLIDGNARAEGHPYYAVGAMDVSDDGRYVAFAEDVVGRRLYTVRILDTHTGTLLPDELYPASPALAWSSDGSTLFFARQDEATLRTYRIVRHRRGDDPSTDAVVVQEDDDTFYLNLAPSKDRRYLIVQSDQTLTTEARILAADDPSGAFRVFRPRQRGHEYEIDHTDAGWIVRSNLGTDGVIGGAPNFQVFAADDAAPNGEAAPWRVIVPHRAEALVEHVEAFRGMLVTQERENGLTRLVVRRPDGSVDHVVPFDAPAYAASLAANPGYDTPVVRYAYATMAAPNAVVDYDTRTRTATVVKQDEVLGGYDPSRYVVERLWATATDGTRIPISLVRRADTPVDGTAPLLLYGYGSYGYSLPAGFSVSRMSLVDRGFVYAIAHVRGGQEMGRAWYEDGKLMRKRHTFTDFVAAAEHLIDQKYADPQRLYAQGGSAGGLLMGAVVNLRPELWDGVVADVPFVDVVTTMLDASIPLTTFEYDEWGNPNERDAFDYMLAYSPYDNVRAVPYPALLVTTGLHDSQVQYWEPAKWVARLREVTTGTEPILLKTNMEAGHGGASGRFRRFREIAFAYAWLVGRADRAR